MKNLIMRWMSSEFVEIEGLNIYAEHTHLAKDNRPNDPRIESIRNQR